MAEWFKAHAWKACLGETLSWVRIPLSPPFKTIYKMVSRNLCDKKLAIHRKHLLKYNQVFLIH